ncbi:hypothetical protein BH11CYA1_BH11CYA1_33570 [soil metagenome]
MHCNNCASGSTKLRQSKNKQNTANCEHCGKAINDKGQRLNRCGLVSDEKGQPKPVEQPFIPRPRRWAQA